jgi:hypothetical protein
VTPVSFLATGSSVNLAAMAKELCDGCSAKLTGSGASCPSCGRPTRHATDADRLEWDLQQWRSHVERSVEAGGTSTSSVATRLADPPAARTPVRPAIEVARRAEAPSVEERPRRRRSIPKPHISRPRLRGRRARTEPALDTLVDADNPFAYRACATCGERDWVVRTTRNDDKTFNYWCVRCSRSFKSELRIRHAIKPFLSGGVVLGGIAALSVLMR